MVISDSDREPPKRNLVTGCLYQWRFYFSQGITEIKHRTCSYMWGCLSVMVVVMLTSVLVSITNKFPVVILMLSEDVGAEIDLLITPGDWNDQFTINASAVRAIVNNLGSAVWISFSFVLSYAFFSPPSIRALRLELMEHLSR